MSENLDFWQVEVDIDSIFERPTAEEEWRDELDHPDTPSDQASQPEGWKDQGDIWKDKDAPSKPAPEHVVVAPSAITPAVTPPEPETSSSNRVWLFSMVTLVAVVGLLGWFLFSAMDWWKGTESQHPTLPTTDPFAFAAIPPADLAAPPSHPSRVYIDAQSRIFLQGQLPVYLHLSTAPDPDAPKFILHKNGIPDRVSPLVLGGDGEQIIRSGEDEYYLYSDGTPPVSEAHMVGARNASREGMTYYGPGLVMTLSSLDERSSVEASYISVDGVPFKEYQDSLYFGKQKRYNLRYYAVDRVGNAAIPVVQDFIVDLSPPQTTLVLEKPFEKTIVSPATQVMLSTSDELSGEGSIYYQFDQPSNFQVYTEPFLLDLDEGEHVLYYYSEDAVGNADEVQAHPFYLDRTPPVVEYALGGDQFRNEDGTLFVSTRSRVHLQASDNKVGVEDIEFSLDDGEVQTYTDSLNVPAIAGAHLLLYRATDLVQNIQVQDSLTMVMDLDAPTSRYALEGPTFHLRDTLYITDGTTIALEATDRASGVARIRYTKDEEPAQDYTSPISIREPGLHRLVFGAIDQVNNREANNRISFIVDKTPPEVFHHFSRAPYAQRQEGGETLGVYAKNTSLYLGATDDVSGTRQIYYSINDAPEQAYHGAVPGLTLEGLYTVQIRVEDNVRNTTVQTIRFYIGQY